MSTTIIYGVCNRALTLNSNGAFFLFAEADFHQAKVDENPLLSL